MSIQEAARRSCVERFVIQDAKARPAGWAFFVTGQGIRRVRQRADAFLATGVRLNETCALSRRTLLEFFAGANAQ